MNRFKRVWASASSAQRNEFHAALLRYRKEFRAQPDNAVRLHILERTILGKNPLEGLEPDGGTTNR